MTNTGLILIQTSIAFTPSCSSWFLISKLYTNRLWSNSALEQKIQIKLGNNKAINAKTILGDYFKKKKKTDTNYITVMCVRFWSRSSALCMIRCMCVFILMRLSLSISLSPSHLLTSLPSPLSCRVLVNPSASLSHSLSFSFSLSSSTLPPICFLSLSLLNFVCPPFLSHSLEVPQLLAHKFVTKRKPVQNGCSWKPKRQMLETRVATQVINVPWIDRVIATAIAL